MINLCYGPQEGIESGSYMFVWCFEKSLIKGFFMGSNVRVLDLKISVHIVKGSFIQENFLLTDLH